MCFLIVPHTPSRLQPTNGVCCASESWVPALGIHQGCAEGHDLLHKHDDSQGEKKKREGLPLLRQRLLKESAALLCRCNFY